MSRWLPTTPYYLLLATCYLLLATCYLPSSRSHVSRWLPAAEGEPAHPNPNPNPNPNLTRWLPAAEGEPALFHVLHDDGDEEDLDEV